MRNVTESMLKTSIRMDAEDFVDLIKKLYPNIDIGLDYNGCIEMSMSGDEDIDYGIEYIFPKLEEYFDVKKVTNLQGDINTPSVWITYVN